MRAKRYSEAELKEMALIADGVYQFEVMEVHDVDKYGVKLCDKDGNDMSKLKLKIWDKNGRERVVFTNLFSDGRMAFRTRHFADSIGMIEEYENDDFDTSDTLCRTGWCQIITRKGGIKNKETNEKWDDSNDVKDFIKLAEQSVYANKAAPVANEFFNDEIPF